ncbi:hypothetical protein [Leptospira johnsonii]|uniref:YcxB-like protein domain-containing protein n=1 Tax=Leptospira johnsonii TaxID=1917820 RepID=A0A2P2D7X4_9LEPT|nr:hypothetical protein [Leptospira johnsonii]GBF40733.1 hypothetical protein LPTSP1_37520 [Leptospira johnsonii]
MNLEVLYNAKEYALTHFLIALFSIRLYLFLVFSLVAGVLMYYYLNSLLYSISFTVFLLLLRLVKIYLFAKEKGVYIQREGNVKHIISLTNENFESAKPGAEFKISWKKISKVSLIGPSIVVFFDAGGVFFIPRSQVEDENNLFKFISDRIIENGV